MPLVTTKEMFEKSMKEGFAIGAFNVNNMELIQGIVDAAAENNSPVILQASSSAIKYARINYLMKMVEAAVEEHPNIPIAIHLDHGPDFETCKKCVDNGFTSVMFDGSKYDFEEKYKMYNEASIISHSGDTTKAILKRTYPLFYWFAYFLDDSWYNFTMEKLRRIRDDKNDAYYDFTRKLQ